MSSCCLGIGVRSPPSPSRSGEPFDVGSIKCVAREHVFTLPCFEAVRWVSSRVWCNFRVRGQLLCEPPSLSLTPSGVPEAEATEINPLRLSRRPSTRPSRHFVWYSPRKQTLACECTTPARARTRIGYRSTKPTKAPSRPRSIRGAANANRSNEARALVALGVCLRLNHSAAAESSFDERSDGFETCDVDRFGSHGIDGIEAAIPADTAQNLRLHEVDELGRRVDVRCDRHARGSAVPRSAIARAIASPRRTRTPPCRLPLA